MNSPNGLSAEQARLQARIAQSRIDAIEKILASGVQAPLAPGTDKDTEEVIARLYDTSLSDADLSSCISILEMVLSLDALSPLISLMKSASCTLSVRQQAARAVAKIGADYVENELAELEKADSAEVRHLAAIALQEQ